MTKTYSLRMMRMTKTYSLRMMRMTKTYSLRMMRMTKRCRWGWSPALSQAHNPYTNSTILKGQSYERFSLSLKYIVLKGLSHEK